MRLTTQAPPAGRCTVSHPTLPHRARHTPLLAGGSVWRLLAAKKGRWASSGEVLKTKEEQVGSSCIIRKIRRTLGQASRTLRVRALGSSAALVPAAALDVPSGEQRCPEFLTKLPPRNSPSTCKAPRATAPARLPRQFVWIWADCLQAPKGRMSPYTFKIKHNWGSIISLVVSAEKPGLSEFSGLLLSTGRLNPT